MTSQAMLTNSAWQHARKTPEGSDWGAIGTAVSALHGAQLVGVKHSVHQLHEFDDDPGVPISGSGGILHPAMTFCPINRTFSPSAVRRKAGGTRHRLVSIGIDAERVGVLWLNSVWGCVCAFRRGIGRCRWRA